MEGFSQFKYIFHRTVKFSILCI